MRKPKGRELHKSEHDYNNQISSLRAPVERAVANLKTRPKLVLIDGNKAPRLAMVTRTIIKGDAKCVSIAAASIIAKVTRDRIMMALARQHPAYGFERHKGYGTPEHQAAIDRHGVCLLHRRSFKPVQLALGLL